MRFLIRSLWAFAFALVSIGLLAYAAFTLNAARSQSSSGGYSGTGPSEQVFTVEVKTIDRETIATKLELYGRVETRRAATLQSASSGVVVALSEAWRMGGEVQEGDLLFAVDPAPARAALVQAQADVSQAEADLAQALRSLSLGQDELAADQAQVALRRRAFERATDLAGRGVGASASVDTAELSLASAEQAVLARRRALSVAQAQVARARIELMRREVEVVERQRLLDETKLRAPFAGHLAVEPLSIGSRVTGGASLGQLLNLRALQVAIPLSKEAHGRLLDEAGGLLPLEVRMTTGAQVLGGRIIGEAPEVGEGRAARLVYAALDQSTGLRVGDFVEVEITAPALQDVARLPASAIGGDGKVLVTAQDSRLALQAVKVLAQEGDDVIIDAAPLEGMQVVLVRTPLLGLGLKVRAEQRAPALN